MKYIVKARFKGVDQTFHVVSAPGIADALKSGVDILEVMHSGKHEGAWCYPVDEFPES